MYGRLSGHIPSLYIILSFSLPLCHYVATVLFVVIIYIYVYVFFICVPYIYMFPFKKMVWRTGEAPSD